MGASRSVPGVPSSRAVDVLDGAVGTTVVPQESRSESVAGLESDTSPVVAGTAVGRTRTIDNDPRPLVERGYDAVNPPTKKET